MSSNDLELKNENQLEQNDQQMNDVSIQQSDSSTEQSSEEVLINLKRTNLFKFNF